MLVLLLSSCGGRPAEPCPCDGGHGVEICGDGSCTPCQCLAFAAPTADPEPITTRFVDADATGGEGSETSPWPVPHWETLDRDVAAGDVLVVFDAADAWAEQLTVARTDLGPHRIVLEGHHLRRSAEGWVPAGDARAIVPGITTGHDDVVVSRFTVRGFDVTGSPNKGIFWRAGDEIVIEDNLVHANRGTPAISLDYTSRTGHRSTSFSVRNNHVWDQKGECIYIGGAEGEDIDAHESLVIENNLVHDCTHPLSSKHDGINVKDRIGNVTVAGNVLFHTHWGIEIASPGDVIGNLVFATTDDAFHVTDQWGLGLSDLVLRDNVILAAGEAGIYMNASTHAWTDVSLSHLTIVDAKEAAIEAGGEHAITGLIEDVVLTDSEVGLDAWAPMDLELVGCTVHGNELAGDRELATLADSCVEADPSFGDLSVPAGPDGWFFTADDPWVSAAGGARPAATPGTD